MPSGAGCAGSRIESPSPDTFRELPIDSLRGRCIRITTTCSELTSPIGHNPVEALLTLISRSLIFAVFVAVATLLSPRAIAFADVGSPSPVASLSAWKGYGATVTMEHPAMRQQHLRIESQPGDWPNAAIAAPTPWDFTGESLLLRLTNPSSSSVTFYVRVDDDPSADGWAHCRTGEATIRAGETADYGFDLGPAHEDGLSMRGLPPIAPVARTFKTYGSPIDWSHIVRVQIFLSHPAQTVTLDLGAASTPPVIPMTGIVDRFGQYTGADWLGKVHDAADLTRQRDAEAAQLAASPALPDRDKYGGWLGGPHLAPSPAFRTQQVGGKWWLVTPEGHLFFSVGPDTIQPQSPTSVSGPRASLFSWLPAMTDPLASHFSTFKARVDGKDIDAQGFDFYGANLERKYGIDYINQWRDISLERLRSWGCNTVGNWSEPLQPNPSVPYVVTLGIWGSHDRVPTGSDYWGAMHDPWDPQMAVDLDRNIAERVPQVKDDPLCIGYYVDNELSWGGGDTMRDKLALAYGALARPAATSPAKRALIADLRKTYAVVTDLNTAWGTAFATWDDLSAPCRPAGEPGDVMASDLTAFVKHFADQYFSVVRTELRKADPNHLYLGCRFAWFTQDEVVEAAKYCDVVSFNIYAPSIDPAKYGFLAGTGKPCIIGEFHFGALDRGMFSPGLVAATDQRERGAMYRRYIESVLDTPEFVGAHWFQYTDEPLVGRFDGENYNIGFVSQTDTVYPELVKAAKQTHGEMYRRRYGNPSP